MRSIKIRNLFSVSSKIGSLTAIHAFAGIISLPLSIKYSNLVGLTEFGLFSTSLTLLSLMSGLAGFGLSESLQHMRAQGLNDKSKLIQIPVLGFILAAIIVIFLLFETSLLGKNITLFQISCFILTIPSLVLIESATRVGFQDGALCRSQIFSSMPAIAVWVSAIAMASNGLSPNKIWAIISVYIFFGVAALYYLIRSFNDTEIKFVWLSTQGIGLRALASRLIASLFDFLPLFAFQSAGKSEFAGLYAYISRYFGPISIVSGAATVLIQRHSFMDQSESIKKLRILSYKINITITALLALILFISIHSFRPQIIYLLESKYNQSLTLSLILLISYKAINLVGKFVLDTLFTELSIKSMVWSLVLVLLLMASLYIALPLIGYISIISICLFIILIIACFLFIKNKRDYFLR